MGRTASRNKKCHAISEENHVFVAVFAVREILIPAKFAVNFPVTGDGIIIFSVDEKVIALTALFEMSFFAFRAKVNCFIFDCNRNQII